MIFYYINCIIEKQRLIMETPIAKLEISYTLENDSKYDTTISIYNYTEKSLAILCDEMFGKAFSEKLKEIGGKYNAKLRIGKGWIFSNNKRGALEELFTKIKAGEIKGEEVIIRQKISKELNPDGLLGSLMKEPSHVSKFKMFLGQLQTIEVDKHIYVEGERIYIYDTPENVENFMKDYESKTIYVDLKTPSHRFVILN